MRDRNAATQQYYPNECTVEDFFDIIDDEKAREMFVKNMENLKLIKLQFPEVWADIFIGWMELNK